jgi:outer membrane immunogenic protein
LSIAPVHAQERDNFDGLYMGLHTGYAWQDVDGVFNNAGSPTYLSGIDTNGGLVGGHLGYNLQYQWIVMGVEADASAIVDSGSTVRNAATNDALTGEVNYLASIRSRLGFVIDDVMLYATAGIGFTEYKFTETAAGVPFTGTLRLRENGAVFGGGVEWKIAYGLALRAEYLHYEVGASSYLPSTYPNVSAGDIVSFGDIDVARVGVSISLDP